MLLQCVFVCYRMCSLTIECVLLLYNVLSDVLYASVMCVCIFEVCCTGISCVVIWCVVFVFAVSLCVCLICLPYMFAICVCLISLRCAVLVSHVL